MVKLRKKKESTSASETALSKSSIEKMMDGSEQLFRLLAESATDLVYRYRFLPQPGFEYVSPSAAAITGYTPEEHYADPLLGHKIIHPDDRPLLEAIKERPSERSEKVIIRWFRKDGRLIWAEQHNQYIRDDEGNVVAVQGSARDITEHVRIEQKLLTYQTAVESSDNMIAMIDRNYVYRLANKSFLDGHGLVKDQVIGRTMAEVLGKELFEGTIKPRVDECLKGNNVNYVRVFHTKALGERYLSVSYSPLIEGGREITGMVGILKDITELKLAGESLRESEERFRELFENISSGVAIYEAVNEGEDFVFKDVNRAVELIEKISREDLLGKKVSEIFPGVKEFGLFEIFQRVWRTGRPEHYPVSFYMDNRIEGWRDNYIYKLSSGDLVSVYEDITDRKLASEALRESEERYRSLVTTSLDAVLLTQPDGRILAANEAACRMFGRSEEELKRIGRSGVVDTSDPRLAMALEERERTGRFRGELSLLRSDGTKFTGELSSAVFSSHDGQLCTSMVIRDITERKQTEESLLRERNFVSAVLDTTPALVVVFDAQGRIVRFNRAAEVTIGYKFEEVKGRLFWYLFVPPNEVEKVKADFYRLEAGNFHYKGEYSWLTKSGKRRLIAWSNSCLLDKQGKIEYFISMGLDISERQKAEQRLRKSQKELRDLSAYLQQVREEERKGISREIHDELGQSLTALKIDLAMLAESMPEKNRELLDQAKSIAELIDHLLHTVKRISADLRPNLLDDFGLVPAIEWQVSEFSKRTGTRCRLSLPDEEIKIDQERSTAIFRILQEALTNIARHAKATEVTIGLEAGRDEIKLTIKDNGIGIREKDLSSYDSLGLIGIRERAYFLKGKVIITGKKKKGTILIATIPLKK